jgi:hypothetical protein
MQFDPDLFFLSTVHPPVRDIGNGHSSSPPDCLCIGDPPATEEPTCGESLPLELALVMPLSGPPALVHVGGEGVEGTLGMHPDRAVSQSQVSTVPTSGMHHLFSSHHLHPSTAPRQRTVIILAVGGG